MNIFNKNFLFICAGIIISITFGIFITSTFTKIDTQVLSDQVNLGDASPYRDWKPTSTPFSALTVATNNRNVYIPGSSVTSSVLSATTFCINNSSPDCITAWPTGSGSSATTTITTNIQSDGPDFTFTTSSATGLDFRITGSGSIINFTPALQSGYGIPLTASTTNWNNFYNTPSTRITAGTGLNWSGNTLNASNAFTGSGTNGYIARWTSASALTTGILLDNGTVSGVNATSATTTFNIQGVAGQNPLNIASSTGSSLLTVLQNGNVGIGTTAPGAKLEVKGSGLTSATTAFQAMNSSSSNILLARNDNRVKVGKSADTNIQNTLEIAGNINFDLVANPTNSEVSSMVLTENAGAGTSLTAGNYYYDIVYVTSDGETSANNSVNIPGITISASSSVTITNVPISTDPRVTARKIFRTAAGGLHYATYYIATISNNTATSFTDTGYSLGTSYGYRKENTTAGMLKLDTANGMLLGVYNTVLGRSALSNNTTGNSLVAIGSNALQSNTTGGGVALGYNALQSNTTGVSNIGIGYASILGNKTGSNNVGIGDDVLRSDGVTAYAYNIGIGTYSFGSLATNNNGNVGIGYNSGNKFNGSYNVMLGTETGSLTATTSANNYNIFLGYAIGKNTAGGANNNILIGKQLNLQDTAGSNQLSIGNLIFGTGVDGTGTTVSTGNIGIATSTPAQKLVVAGDARVTGAFFDSSNASGTSGMILQSTGVGTSWVSTSSLGISGGSGITSLNGETGSSQSFATSTSGGLDLFINSATDVHTFTLQPATDFTIPLTASTTEWATAYAYSQVGHLPLAGGIVAGALNASSTLAVTSGVTFYSTLNVTGKTTLGLASTTAVTATTLYGALVGNASTATALASDPTDCGANTWATTIVANGNLTCGAVTYAGISAMTSANWAGVISDETGSGALVFNTSPIFLTSITIPTSTNPTVDVVGKIAINTTAASSSIRWHDGTAERATYAEIEKGLYFTSSTIDKSSISFSSSTATTTFEIFNSARGFTLNQFYCKTDAGTVAVRFGDGTNWTASISCTTSGGSGTGLSNNTFTPRENFVVQVGSAATTTNKVTITTGLIYVAD